ncbi:hypothetical protein [Bacillus sp. S/N-304-OC-R1]|uniref:hypothetical protein n=1 Tax=Bacillus sp. S/N-304-OC-R1 TaxID=2758034 RepID=UPI001C8D9735|nr:hypothetical protein [Bacillus sp. S/N-304-OC-R1]MBY0122298.1 hypothetical protein [Bacillus sp. S/N-304-OC-R1]
MEEKTAILPVGFREGACHHLKEKDKISISNGILKASQTAEKGIYTLIAKYQDKEVRTDIDVKIVLTKITWNSQRVTLKPGDTQQLEITAHYLDNSTEVVTRQATYTSSNVKRATVSAEESLRSQLKQQTVQLTLQPNMEIT